MAEKELRKNIYETNFEFCDDDKPACFSSTDSVWIKRILRLAKQHPDEVKIVDYKERESICVNVPKGWFKVSPPRKVNMTEEQKSAAVERMRKAREKKEEKKQEEESWL